jgi:hypothetical protein
MKWFSINNSDPFKNEFPSKGKYVLLFIPDNPWDDDWPYYFGYWKDSAGGGKVWTVYPNRPMDGQNVSITHWAQLNSPTDTSF